jgi:hypothetical protein
VYPLFQADELAGADQASGTVEMNSGLLVSGRHLSPRLWVLRSQ